MWIRLAGRDPRTIAHSSNDSAKRTFNGSRALMIKILTIEREYGSGAAEIAQKLADP
jgi:hypothetical protein